MFAFKYLQQIKTHRNKIIYMTTGISVSDPYHYLCKTIGAFDTIEKCEKEFKKRPNSFKFFPNDNKTLEMFIELVHQNEKDSCHPQFSDYIHNVNNLHKYILDDICKAYIKNAHHLEYIPKNRIIKILMEKPKLIEFIKDHNQTKEMVDIVLKKNENLVKFVNPYLLSLGYFEKNPKIIKYISHNQQEMWMAEYIINKHGNLSQYLRHSLVETYMMDSFKKNKNLKDLNGINISGKNFKRLMVDTKFKFVQDTRRSTPINVNDDDDVKFEMGNIKEIIVVIDDKKPLCRARTK